MIGNFKYWKDGKPVTPNTGLTEFKYWKNGKPFIVYESGSPPPTTVIPVIIKHLRNQGIA